MKIAIIGTGAMGSVYAVLLAKAGHEIWAIDKWKEHIKAIRTLGLRLEGASGDNTETSIQATTDISKAGACDLYIIATKADGVADAALAISQIMKKDSLILTIQNGLGAGKRIAQYISTDNVLLGVAEGFGASIKSPGHAHHNSMRQIRLGEMDGGLTERLKSVEEIWKNAGFNANAFSDIHQLIWEKYICNVFVSAPCTVFDCTIGELIGHLPYREIALGCMREAFRAGKAKGINFSFEDEDSYAMKFAENMPNASPSMRLDHIAKRKSEIDFINGMVPVVSEEMGLVAPYNETISAVVRKIEDCF